MEYEILENKREYIETYIFFLETVRLKSLTIRKGGKKRAGKTYEKATVTFRCFEMERASGKVQHVEMPREIRDVCRTE